MARAYKRDKIGRFAGIGAALSARRAKKANAKSAKRQQKRAKSIERRDSTFHDLRSTQNQFSEREARDYVNSAFPGLKSVPIAPRSSLKVKPVHPVYKPGK